VREQEPVKRPNRAEVPRVGGADLVVAEPRAEVVALPGAVAVLVGVKINL
jgi:hypothetical protein